MKPIYKYSLLLAATPLILSACDGMTGDNTDPDEEPVEETVTLTLKSAVPGSGAKTSVNEDGIVFWNAGDIVHINGESYEVVPLESDPSLAMVENVRKNDEYFVSYPEPLNDTGNGYYEVNIPEYQTNELRDNNAGVSYGIQANPMLAYSTSEEIDFFNVGAILGLGISGYETVTGISVTSNDGRPIAGSLQVPVDEVISGFLSDRYMWAGTEYRRVYLDCVTKLSPSEESLFYIVVAPEAYEEGITVYVRDDSGNVAIQSSYDAQNLFRNSLVTKETFKVSPEQSPGLVPVSVGTDRLEYEVYAQHGAYVKTAVIRKLDYEAAAGSGMESFVYEVLGKDMSDAVLIGSEERYEFSSKEAYDINMQTVAIEPDTEYIILAAYSDSVDIFEKTISTAEVRTEASSVDPEPSQSGVTTEDFTIGNELKWQ